MRQLVDDVLDYESSENTLGKPGGADLKLGLATAPALFAWEENAAMGDLIERRFSAEGDVEMVRERPHALCPYSCISVRHETVFGNRARCKGHEISHNSIRTRRVTSCNICRPARLVTR